MPPFGWYALAVVVANLIALPFVRRSFVLAVQNSKKAAQEFDAAVARGETPMVASPDGTSMVPDRRPVVLEDALPDMFAYSVGAIVTNSVIALALTWCVRFAWGLLN